MITYKYTALSRDGAKVNGVVEAYNEPDAVDRIKQSCDVVLKLAPVSDQPGLLNREVGGDKLNLKALTVVCSQFAIILKAGIPVARTVQLIADKTTDKPLKRILLKVAEDVEAGRSLSASLEDNGGKLLPVTFIETIRAGEESGSIDRAFAKMHTHFEKQTRTAGRVKSALTYPAFVLVIAVVVVIVLMAKVVPTFTDIFASYGSELPAITQSLVDLSDFFRKYWMIMLAVLALLLLGYKLYSNTEEGRLKTSRLSLDVPVLGNIGRLNAASQFANNMAALLGAGLPTTRAVSITAKVIDNYFVAQEIGKTAGRIEEGRSIADSMRHTECLPDILIDMVAVGEETGELENTLNTVAEFYDNELETAINDALAKLEPTLLVVMAAIAGYIVIAMYVAMFQMYSVM